MSKAVRVPWVAICCLSLAACLSHSEPVPPGYTAGTPWVGPRGVREQTGDIMQRQARQGGKKAPYRERLRATVDLVEYVNNPESSAPLPLAGPAPAVSSTAQSLGVSFLGATLADTRAYPPDSMGAVGPAQYIVAVNGRIRSFNKFSGTADGILDVDTDVFFNSVMTPPATNNFTSDPRIRYDRLSRRWFIIMIDVPGQAGTLPDRIMIAVSDGPIVSSSSSWTLFWFEHDLVSPAGDTGEFADYPTLGIDANALYIGVNIFASRGRGTFDNTTAFVVRKSSLLVSANAPTNIVVTAFRGLIPNGSSGGPYTPQGVDNYDPNATEGYVIGVTSTHNFLVFGQLSLRRVSNPGGAPSISPSVSITIPLNGGTINVPHLGNTGGTSGYLDGLDYRLLGAHFRNGRLWTAENMAVDNTGSPSGTDTRMSVRWYELSGIASGQTPAVVQSGTLYQPSASNTTDQRCYWMGSIMVSGQGHAALGFSVAGANEYANAGTAGRLAGDAPGTLRAPLLYTSSSSAYNPRDSTGNPINRWGDYSYTCLDPNDDMTMWTIQEFCNAPNSYGVQVVKLLAPPPATPSACSPSSATNGAANMTVVLTGSSDGDTGFFDPGLGFSNRVAATVNGGGVTVNSVTYSDPTHLTLNLSVAASVASGARTITVTNPDGQSATSATAILNIFSTASNSPPVLTFIPDKIVDELTTLIFTNTATDHDGDALTFSLDPGAPTGAAVNPTNGVFTWTPTEAQGPGSYPITVRVTDNGSPPLSATNSFTVTVNEVNGPPVLAPIASRTIHQGTTLLVTNAATDPDLPANTLTFSLGTNAPAGATINAVSGIFSWTPGPAFLNTTNGITVKVTDNGSPPLSDEKSFSVAVVSRPMIQSITLSNGVVGITWSAIAGQGYSLQTNAALTGTNWSDLASMVTAGGPTAAQTNPVAPGALQFYRVKVVP